MKIPSRLRFLSVFGILLGVLGFTYSKPPHPHVILIVADDLGWNDVSFHGSKQIPTPNIDTLAYSGTILNNYYVQPLCTPTRSALLTARHPVQTGMQFSVILPAQPYGLPLNETLMPQYLKRMGYATHMVGKWHIGAFAKEYTPTYRGFDTHLGYWLGAEDYWDHSIEVSYNGANYTGVDFHDGMETIRDEAGKYSTHIFTKRAQDIIQNHNSDEPLFLYFAHQAVHSADGGTTPMEAPQEYIDKFQYISDQNRRVYAAMASIMDESIGNVTKTLHDKGMLEDSIIVFTTDNGGPADGYDSNWASNVPLRGRKGSMWEGGTRGAAFIWSPMLKAPGSVSNQMMHVTDWLPTLLSAVGYDTTTLPSNLFGMDMWSTLNNPQAQSPRKEFLYNIDTAHNRHAVRVNNYKLIQDVWSRDWYPQPQFEEKQMNKNKKVPNNNVVIMTQNHDPDNIPKHLFSSDLGPILESYGFVINSPQPVVIKCGPKPANASTNCKPETAACLYDLSVDPCEYNNIADQYPNIVEQLQEKLAQYKAISVPPRNKDVDPDCLPQKHHDAWEVCVDL